MILPASLNFRSSYSRVTSTDRLRRELIFNIVLATLLLLAMVAATVSTFDFFDTEIQHFGSTIIFTAVYASGTALLLILSRSGHLQIAASVFIAVLSVDVIQLMLDWGLMLPTVVLMIVMIIVVAGSLLGARHGLMGSVISSFIILIIGFLEQNKWIKSDAEWINKPFRISDALAYAVIFVLIGLLTWLANRERDASLRRALKSEKDLAAIRDCLELKVIERTKALEAEQFVRLMELKKFAEFGRLSANLLHEVATPLTAAALNLEQLDEGQSKLVLQARKNIQHMERYVVAARQQMQGNGETALFNVKYEVHQVMQLVSARAKAKNVTIHFKQDRTIKLYGDHVKFSQIIANLLINAIDAYDGIMVANKRVELDIRSDGPTVICTVKDYGCGIPMQSIGKVFDPFYTTKTASNTHMGIGLAMVKQFATEVFNGTVNVTSSPENGTVFMATLNDSPPEC